MVDLVGNLWPVLAQRIVRQLRQMHHCIEALKIALLDATKILDDRARNQSELTRVAVEPAIAVETRVQAHDLVPARHQYRRQSRPYIALCSSDQYLHADVHLYIEVERPLLAQPSAAGLHECGRKLIEITPGS